MSYKKILTIQDISCVGQCSLTVALPILSACGIETCILPSAVLSTHTAGFSGYTFRDLTDDFPAIEKHWISEGIRFDCIYTGYLGSTKQIDYVKDIIGSLLAEGGTVIVDPAMADNGKLYPAFDGEYVEAMKDLAFSADIMLPNITELCLLVDAPYRDSYDEDYIKGLVAAAAGKADGTLVLTGVSYDDATTGVVVSDRDGFKYYRHKLIEKGCHGTGDVYASAFTGAYMHGRSAYDSARIAADYTVSCIENTVGDSSHWYGVKFETALGKLIEELGEE